MSRRRSQSTPEARKGRSGDAEGDGVLGGKIAHVLSGGPSRWGCRLQHAFVLGYTVWHDGEKAFGPAAKRSSGGSSETTADAEVAELIMRWPETDSKMRHEVFALAPAVEEHGEGAYVEGVGYRARRDATEMRVSSLSMTRKVLGALGEFRGPTASRSARQ